MSKKQDFMSKTMKHSKQSTCPVCNNPITNIKLVNTEQKKDSGAWRFNQSNIAVCKCNESKDLHPLAVR